MYMENGKISERQAFRVGLLENITIGMVVIPYITTSMAGDLHIRALYLGIALSCLYAMLVFGFSKWFPEGLISALNDNLGWLGRVFDIVYAFRYVLRGALIMLFFVTVIHEYMLKSTKAWVIAIPFAAICGYGALRDIEKRGRLLEFLFWWMIVPLILVAVFAISNVDWGSLPRELSANGAPLFSRWLSDGVLPAAYLSFLVLSSVELMIFTLPRQKQNSWKNGLKILVWIVIAVVLAYVFIVGILGVDWVKTGSTVSMNVIEASAFPGGLVERMDYPVLAFWVIGVFAVISGYLFYARQFADRLFRVESTKGHALIMLCVVILLLLGMWCWLEPLSAVWLVRYVIWMDIGVSVLVPLLVLSVRSVKRRADNK